MDILIVKLGALGDVINTLPTIYSEIAGRSPVKQGRDGLC